MIWTKDAEHALQNCRIEKKLMTDTNNKFLGKPNMIKKIYWRPKRNDINLSNGIYNI